MSRKRIAICISGQIRSSYERLAEIQAEADEIGADIFMSVWAGRGGKTFDAGHRLNNLFRIFGGKSALFFPIKWAEAFKEVFPEWRNFLPRPNQVELTELQKVFPDAIIEIEPEMPELDLPGEINSLRMLYKVERCNRLKRQHEKANGFRYDRVIRTRPDILLSFKSMLLSTCSDDELHVKIRAGKTLHDTYWMGTSDVEDKIAKFFDIAKTERLKDWKGIHIELANYVAKCGLTPVNLHCVKEGFEEFGDYSVSEHQKTVQNFHQLLGKINLGTAKSGGEGFRQIMQEVFSYVCNEAFDENPDLPKTDLQHKLQTLMASNKNDDDILDALSSVSMVYVLNQNVDPRLRGMLALNVLMLDALEWPAFQALRSADIISNLPWSGAEYLPFLKDPELIFKKTENGELADGFHNLWGSRFGKYSKDQLLIARSKVMRTMLNNNDSRHYIAVHLKENKLFQSYLDLANLYKTEFPERSNASRFVLQAQKMLDASEHG